MSRLHAAKTQALREQLSRGAGPVGLAKDTSNLFRDRAAGGRRRLDVRRFRDVLEVNAREGWVDAEGMVTYEDLVRGCLAQGVMPAVVPQLKTITLGGAMAGVGIEASSHRYGLVHDTAQEIEVLLGDGSIVLATPDNEHAGLFYGFPNSYGTLGYALRVKAKVVPVRRYVRLEHQPFAEAPRFFAALGERLRAGEADFIDGVVFGPREMVLTLGRFADQAPATSDYTFENIYYRSLRERREDFLSVHDYLWRWDTDWFWCSKNVGAQNPLVRRFVYGRKRLGSRTYTKIMRWNARVGLTKKLERLAGLHSESIIQDVDIPLERAGEFLEFYARDIGLWPQWVCPIGPAPHAGRFTLYPMAPGWYVNFGFWDVKRTRAAHPPGHFNRLVERKVAELGGIKSLYSESFFPQEEFRAAYGGAAYDALKRKYDPQGAFPTLYEKCVLRA
ncbi:MAG: FAD-binding oxidoreductase [Betaproteobacteria bacterium]|nr:FAD-binding oxidoreductase [Betaproteobacteria bacterium]MDH5350968.1 FAD-binding oxidoreductase [Betaproteobacteria bacterium]